MSKQITLKKLSIILGVSVSTISKALNDSYEISETTKKRIREAADLYNYQPNIAAINLKSGRTNTIGVIIPNVQNYFMGRVLYGIEDFIASSPYNAIVCTTKESLDREKRSVRSLSNGLVDGFIIAVSEETQVQHDYDHLQFALDKGKPIVMFDRVVKNLECDKIIIDDYEAIFNATTEMKASGLQNILTATTIQNLSVGKSRIKGYSDVVKNPIIVEGGSDTIELLISDKLKNGQYDAIMALDEESTLASLRACKKLNLAVPDQVSIVGYTGRIMADNVTPKLTTINQHGYTTGRTAVEMLLQKIAAKSTEVKSKNIHSTFIKRESTKF